MSKDHALLSPSSSERWLNCSGSFLLPQFNEERDTTAADEGTLMHRISEYKLLRDEWYDYKKELEECRKDELYFLTMEKYSDDYVGFIHSQDYDQILVEELLNLSYIYPDFFGTSDCILMKGGEDPKLHVIDLKFGKYKVTPENNSQLMIYALGAVRLFQRKFPEIKGKSNFNIDITIYQPRIDNISTWNTDYQTLKGWTQDTLIPALSKIQHEVIEQNKGRWCRFCEARVFCKAYNDTYIGFDPEDIKALTNEEIERNLLTLEPLENYLKTLKNYIKEELQNGVEFNSFKLKKGSNRRFWNNEEKLKEQLIENNDFDKVVKLPSPFQLGKAVGKEKMETYYNQFIETKEDKPSLVKTEERREESTIEDK